MSDVQAYLDALPSVTRDSIDALRSIVKAAGPDLHESIKWNAPSFALDCEDRITLGVERKGGVRAVLHRGSKRVEDHFTFDDPDGLAKWPSPDRGVLIFADASAVNANRQSLKILFTRWLEATH
ncbi:hypothetical protein GCM10023219_14950 [Stakelama sediminis]|uniref:YdhG-like domain-containing protein n=1 Tax=Stakelama sediminis TaxID=463200 RepID=A0A840YXG6_9SPHN|nr:hypothetical protein [Stakelama sediminis]